jgi:hypothetical protein
VILWSRVPIWICTNGSTSIQLNEAFFTHPRSKRSLGKQCRNCAHSTRKRGIHTTIRFGRLQADVHHRTADVPPSGHSPKRDGGAHVPSTVALPAVAMREPRDAAIEHSSGVGVATGPKPRRATNQTKHLLCVCERCNVRSGRGRIHRERGWDVRMAPAMAISPGQHAGGGANVASVHRRTTRGTNGPAVHHMPTVCGMHSEGQ